MNLWIVSLFLSASICDLLASRQEQLTGESEVPGGESNLSDLVRDATDGDADAWDQIVDRMGNMVWSVVRSFRLSDADAHDASQMIWLRIVENISKVRDPDRLGLWIATTSRRECMRLIEKKRRTVPVDPDEGFARLTVSGDIETEQVNRSEAQRVVDALVTLSDDCQALLRLVLCDSPMSYQGCLSRLRAAANL